MCGSIPAPLPAQNAASAQLGKIWLTGRSTSTCSLRRSKLPRSSRSSQFNARKEHREEQEPQLYQARPRPVPQRRHEETAEAAQGPTSLFRMRTTKDSSSPSYPLILFRQRLARRARNLLDPNWEPKGCVGRRFPRWYPGMTAENYILMFQCLNNSNLEGVGKHPLLFVFGTEHVLQTPRYRLDESSST